MPSRIKGISAKLIEAAREEFFMNGYEAASIRDIAAKAETSPRAVYTTDAPFCEENSVGSAFVTYADIYKLIKRCFVSLSKHCSRTLTSELFCGILCM